LFRCRAGAVLRAEPPRRALVRPQVPPAASRVARRRDRVRRDAGDRLRRRATAPGL